MNPEQKAYEAALKARLAERARTLLATNTQVLKTLQDARLQILAQLAAQPADWKRWQLGQVLAQLDVILSAATSQAGTAADVGLRQMWQQGEDVVDKPLAAAGIQVEMHLPLLDVSVLNAMRAFTLERLSNVGTEAMGKIRQQLGLVTLGGVTPGQAIEAIQQQLGSATPQRATTIVRTELSRAFAVASQERLAQAAGLIPGLQKQWRRSGKLHSRWTHDLMDGQVVDADKPFKVPNPDGGTDLMSGPHDPQAPAGQVINCGCLALPFRKGWKTSTPGAKPFTERELKADPGKREMDRQAKAAGLRLEPLAHADKAVVPAGKLAGYVLNTAHPVGGNKARVIRSTLGYTAEDADDFEKAIVDALPHQVAKQTQVNTFGTSYQVDVPVTGPAGSAIVRTGWIVLPGEEAPRMTTAYIKDRKKQ